MASCSVPSKPLPFVLLLLLLSGLLVQPAVGQWTSIGPDGGSVNVLAIDPVTPSTLYVGTFAGGVFKSTDAGASWRPMNAGLLGPFGFPALRISEMVIDPVTPQTLYVGVHNAGMFKSTDGAHSWVAANQRIPANDTIIWALGMDPSSPSTLFIGTGFNRVFRSTDGAASWQQLLDDLGRPDAVAVAPSNSSIVYLGAGFNMAYKSTDGGDTWNSVSTGLEDGFGQNQITVHPTDPNIVYIATDAGLHKTTNGGTSWVLLTTLNFSITFVVLDPSNPMSVYAGAEKVGALLKSTNGGGSFVEKDVSTAVVPTMAFDPANPQILYAATNPLEGVFKSTDGGNSWAASNSGLSNIDMRAIAFDPQDTSTIYAASAFGGGVHKSIDGGQTWESKRGSGMNGFEEVLDVVVDPVNPSNVYLGTSFAGGIFWSDDGGESWNSAPVLAKVPELGIHPGNPSTLYAAHFGGVYKSTNQARNWELVGNGLPNNVDYLSLAVDPSDGDTVYAGATPGFQGGDPAVYKTTNGGGAWAAMTNGFALRGVNSLEIDPANPDILYAGGPGGFGATTVIQKSTDGGANWAARDTGIPLDLSVSALAIDPFNSSVVYAGTNASGVYKSSDGGATWSEYNTGLSHVTINDLAINPSDSNDIIAAVHHFSLFRYQSLSPQWLFAAGDPAGIGNLFDSVALSNYSGEAAVVGLAAIDDSTSGKAAGQGNLRPLGGNQQVDLDLPAGEQFTNLRGNIFGGDVTLPAWIELTSDNPDIASFFQFGSGTLTQLDGGVAIENLTTKFYFQRVFDGPAAFRGQSAITRLTVLNPGDEEVTVDLRYFPPEEGPLGQPRQGTRKIPARSFLDEMASSVFGTSISGGYVAGEVTEGGGVAAFEVVQLSDRPMVLGLNASTGNSSTRSFSAQLASRPDVFTNVNLINTAAGSRNVDLMAVRAAGGIEGDPVRIVLAAGASFSADASQIFGFGAAPADGGLRGGQFVGSLEVEADGDGVVGDVIFGDPGELAFAASLPLQSEPFTEAIFSQFADDPGLFFTGLAFYYPGDIGSSPQGGSPDTDITVEVILASGESIGESTFKLSPGERTDKSLSELAPAAAGKANGYMLVTSTQPLIGQVVFVALGGGGISLFSAVPPKVIR